MARIIHQPQQEEPALARRRCIANALFAVVLFLSGILLIDPSLQATLFPACPIHEYLGILCPGCGSTRALAALLRGRFAEAIHFNALFVLFLPIALVGALATYRRALKPARFLWPQPPAPAIYFTVAATAIFTIVRNLT